MKVAGTASAAGKGMLSESCRASIAAVMATYPQARTALLPALKLAQQEIGWLPPALVAEVADLVGASHAQAQELTTFYSMLHTEPHGELLVEVCTQLPCGFMGGERLLADLEKGLGIADGGTTKDGVVTLHKTVECMGACHRAPMCRVGTRYVENVRTEADVAELVAALRQGRVPETPGTLSHDFHPVATKPSKPAFAYEPVLLPRQPRTTRVSLAEYRAAGGYLGLEKALRHMQPAEVLELVKASNLRGRGGAAFSTGLKWSFVPKVPGPKYLVVNADESEPGTFKDRELMEVESHMLIEGMAIASYAIGCHEAFLYIRGEYVEAGERMRASIAEAKAEGLLGAKVLGTAFPLEIHVFLGAGAYICGEETALLESLEGHRPMPRSRPPFPAVVGLYGRPTVVNNVETIVNVPHIVTRGADWYKTLGPNQRSAGPKIFCLAGAVNRPGNYELPLGSVTFRELIEQFGGGVTAGHRIKGVLPAGISAPIVPAGKLDTKLDYESVQAAGSMLGSASLIVIPDDVDIVRAATRMVEFFRHESCGKCTPCREGVAWLHKILLRIEAGKGEPKDLDLLLSLSARISGKVLCALGDFATSPVTATLQHFRSEFLDAIVDGRGAPRRLEAALVSELVNLTINGNKVTCPKGTLLVEASLSVDIEIPVFCYHKKLKPVGACRMCLVEIEKMPRLQTACTTPVAEGMVVQTASAAAVEGQQAVLEMILANHPLDCPVCDKGGECPLQDNTFRYGSSMSRMSEEKRAKDKAFPLSDLIALDRERCIMCYRCTRFQEEIAGDGALVALDRGGESEIGTLDGEAFVSPFSGNTIELCPVGR